MNVLHGSTEERKDLPKQSLKKPVDPGQVDGLGGRHCLDVYATLVRLVRRCLDVELLHKLCNCRLDFRHIVHRVVALANNNDQIGLLVPDKAFKSSSRYIDRLLHFQAMQVHLMLWS